MQPVRRLGEEVDVTAVEKIQVAEDRVERLQDGLDSVQVVLAKAEEVAVSGQKAAHRVRKTILTLLVLGILIAVIASVAKKMSMSDPEPADAPVEPEASDEAADDEPA